MVIALCVEVVVSDGDRFVHETVCVNKVTLAASFGAQALLVLKHGVVVRAVSLASLL